MQNPRHLPKKTYSASLCTNKPFLVSLASLPCVTTSFNCVLVIYLSPPTYLATYWSDETLDWGWHRGDQGHDWRVPQRPRWVGEEASVPFLAYMQPFDYKTALKNARCGESVGWGTDMSTAHYQKWFVCTKWSGIGFFREVSRALHVAVNSTIIFPPKKY